MLTLYKNRDNNVPMSLNEKATQVQHDWLIELVNEMTGEKTYYTPEDISTASEVGTTKRYNEFVIPGEGLTGFSKYNAYEMPVMSPKSTNPALAYKLCESGKVIIIDESENPVIEFTEDENKNNVVFDE